MTSRNFLTVSAALMFVSIATAQPKQEAQPAQIPSTPTAPSADAKAAPDAKPAAKTEAPPADSGDAKWGPTSTKDLKICDLYESAAVLKAKAKTEVSATCACTQTTTECGKNWRGAMKYVASFASEGAGPVVPDGACRPRPAQPSRMARRHCWTLFPIPRWRD